MPTNAGSMLAQWTLMSHLAEPTFTTDIDPSVCDNVYVVECRNTTRMMHDIEKHVEQKNEESYARYKKYKRNILC